MTVNPLLLALGLLGVVILATGAVLGVLLTQLIPGSGGQTPPRPDQRFTPAQNPAVAPGTTNIIRARQVIVFGPNEGVFVYSGTPALGNPPIMSMSNSSTDPFGNTTDSAGQPLQPGIVAYGSTGYAQLLSGILSFLYPGAFTPGVVDMEGAGAMVINSGDAISGDNSAEIVILSQNAGGGTSQVQLDAGLVETSGAAQVGGNLTVNGSTISAGGVTAIDFDTAVMDIKNGDINLNMAAPPNAAAVIAGTATQAQYNACLGGMLNSMTNRQLFA